MILDRNRKYMLFFFKNSGGKISIVKVKEMVLVLCVILITATENISQNALNDYFVLNDIFYLVVFVVRKHADNSKMVKNALVALVSLCNFRKYESENAYLKRFSSLQQHEPLMVILNYREGFSFAQSNDKSNNYYKMHPLSSVSQKLFLGPWKLGSPIFRENISPRITKASFRKCMNGYRRCGRLFRRIK